MEKNHSMESNQKISFLRLIPETFRFIKENWAANIISLAILIVLYGLLMFYYLQAFPSIYVDPYVNQHITPTEFLKLFSLQGIIMILLIILATGYIGYMSNAARGIVWTVKETLTTGLKRSWRVFVSMLLATSFLSIAMFILFIPIGFVSAATLASDQSIGIGISVILMVLLYFIMILFCATYLPIYLIEVVHKNNILDSISRSEKMLKKSKLRFAGTQMLIGLLSLLVTGPVIFASIRTQIVNQMYTPEITLPYITVSIFACLVAFYIYNYWILAHYYLDERLILLNTPDEYEELA